MSKAFLLLCLPLAAAIPNCGGTETRRAPNDATAGQAGHNESEGGSSGQAAGGNPSQPGGGRGGQPPTDSDGGIGGGAAGAPDITGDAGNSGSAGGGAGGEGSGAGGEGGSAGDAGGGAGGEGGHTGNVLPEGVIANVAYTCSSPFDEVSFPSYFYLEDWEDSTLNTPGVTSTSLTPSSSFGVPSLIDSVDCDDGVADGTCLDCDALFANGSVELSFDAQTLGGLPTHVGMVWTDGGTATNVTFTVYDAVDTVISTQIVNGVGDGSNYNTTAEDRFFGIVSHGGIKRVLLSNSSGGIEIDHLQYGR